MAIIPRGFDLGTLEVGVKENAAVICSVTYIKGILDGAEIFEKDKVNLIDRVDGPSRAAGGFNRQAMAKWLPPRFCEGVWPG